MPKLERKEENCNQEWEKLKVRQENKYVEIALQKGEASEKTWKQHCARTQKQNKQSRERKKT